MEKKANKSSGNLSKAHKKSKETNDNGRWLKVFHYSFVGFIRFSISIGKAKYVNNAGYKNLGYKSKKDFLAHFNLENHIIGNYPRKQFYEMMSKNGFISGMIVRMMRKDTTFFWAEVDCYSDTDHDFVDLIIIDITERKRMEEVRSYTGRTLKSIKRTIPDIIYKLDNDGNITFISDPVRSYGYSPEELIGRRIIDLVHPEDKEKATYRINERRTGIRSTKALEIRLLKKSELGLSINQLKRKRDIPISLIAAEGLYDAENEQIRHFIGTQGIVVDITERKRTEEALRKSKEAAESANLLKSKFLANMSHNVRTPLNGILGFANLLLKSEIQDETREYLNNIINSADELLNLMNDILDYSNMETGQLDIYKDRFKLNDLIKYIKAMANLPYRHKEVEFKIKSGTNIPEYAFNDKWRIQQVLTNLISNAFKFTEMGHVTLSFLYDDDSDFLIFTISDTGIGISQKNLEQVFLPFFQVSSSKTKSVKGPGLGLAICKNLVELMGGSIKIQSEPNKGSEFTVYIPANLNQIPEEIYEKEILSKDELIASLEEKRNSIILIAEDNPVNQMLIAEQFKKKGFHSILIAKNGREAVDLATANDPDLILMDIQMPVMNGNEAIQLLRQNNYKKPILAVSAYGIREEINRSLEIGANDYILKPIDFNHFFPKINEYLTIKDEDIKQTLTPSKKRFSEKQPDAKISDTVSANVLAIFVEDAQEKLKVIEKAVGEDNFSQYRSNISAIAHEYKGNASYFGLHDLEAVAKELDMGFKQDLPDKDLLPLTKKMYEMIKAIISQNS